MKSIALTLAAALLSASAEGQETVRVEQAYRTSVLTGFTRERSVMSLSNEIAGKVVSVFADVGSPIDGSGRFACVDDTYVRLSMKAVNNDIANQKIDQDFYEKQVLRHRKMADQNSTSKASLEEIERQFDSASLRVTAGVIRRQTLEEDIKRHCIKAPPEWLVTERKVEVGQWIGVGQAVGEVRDFSRLIVPFSLSSDELLALKGTEKIKLNLLDHHKQVSAKIERVSPVFDDKTRKTAVELIIDETLSGLNGGVRVGLELNLSVDNSVFMIDSRALDQRYELVWLHRKDGRKVKVKLLSKSSDNKAKISSDELSVGDEFLIIE